MAQGVATPTPGVPFRQSTEMATPVISLVLAERLFKENKISRQLLKMIRKSHERLASGDLKKAEKAKVALERASRNPIFSGRAD